MWPIIKIVTLLPSACWVVDKIKNWKKKEGFKVIMICTKTYKDGDKEKELKKARDNPFLFAATANTVEVK